MTGDGCRRLSIGLLAEGLDLLLKVVVFIDESSQQLRLHRAVREGHHFRVAAELDLVLIDANDDLLR